MPTDSTRSTDQGRYAMFELNDYSEQHMPRADGECDGRQPSTKSWRAPAFMLISLTIGLGLALAHHSMGLKLDHRPVFDVSISQAWVFRFSTALAFLVKVAFATSIGTAYIQHQWLRLRQQTFKTNEVEAMTSVLGSMLSFLSSAVWLKHPVLLIMALMSWLLPLAAIIAPGSLTVSPVRSIETIDVQVAQPNFANMSKSSIKWVMWRRPDVRLSRLTYQVATSGKPVPLIPPYANSSYHLQFDGPTLRCAAASEAVTLNVTSDMGSDFNIPKINYFPWASWTGQYPRGQFNRSYKDALDFSEDGARLSVMTNRGANGWKRFAELYSISYNRILSRQVANVTECVLYNATYKVDFVFQDGVQTQNVSITKWLHPVRVPNGNDKGDNENSIAYGAVMEVLGTLMVGLVKIEGFDTIITSMGQEMLNIDWDGEPQAIQQSLEQLSQNLTLSLLSNSDYLMNSTNAISVPVQVFTWPVTYQYAKLDLLIAYGSAFACAFICSAIGLYAFSANGASYQNLFSTYFRATNDLRLRSQLRADDNGADPLPKALAQSRVALGGYVGDGGVDDEPADHQHLDPDDPDTFLRSDWGNTDDGGAISPLHGSNDLDNAGSVRMESQESRTHRGP